MFTAQLNYEGIVVYLTIASRMNAFNVEKVCVERGSTSSTSMFIMSTQHMKCGAKHNGVLGEANLWLNV